MELCCRALFVCVLLFIPCSVAFAADTAANAGAGPMWHSPKPADSAVTKAIEQPPATVPEAATPEVAEPQAREPQAAEPVTLAAASSTSDALDADDLLLLEERGWAERTAQAPAIWVSVSRQRLYLIQGTRLLWSAPCGTATNGAGAQAGSNQTPLGWHKVGEKFGDGAKWGQVFRSRRATREIWAPGMDTKEDLVLTRILWLEGLEPGINQGTDKKGNLVDSRRRYIYIHGTNGEDQIGQPSSHGCIRLLNNDVITLFNQTPKGTPVLITE